MGRGERVGGNPPPGSANVAANESAPRFTRLGGRDQIFGGWHEIRPIKRCLCEPCSYHSILHGTPQSVLHPKLWFLATSPKFADSEGGGRLWGGPVQAGESSTTVGMPTHSNPLVAAALRRRSPVQMEQRDELLGQDARVHEPLRHQHVLTDQRKVRDDHGHRPEQSLEILRELRAAQISCHKSGFGAWDQG